MLNRRRLLFALALAATLCPATAFADFAPYSPTALGWTAAQNISVGFTSLAVDMGGAAGGPDYTKLSLPMTIVWGTSASFLLRLQGSQDGTTWHYVPRCTSADPHVCKIRAWEFQAAHWVAGNPVLTFTETDYRYLRIELVAGAGTGTVLVTTATRAP